MERLYSVETPCYVVDEKRLIENLEILREIAERAGCKILLAQKAFSMFAVYPLIGRYLDGTTASGLFEARLGFEEMGKETHVFSAAYNEREFHEIVKICDHISFNSFAQWQKYKEKALAAGKSCGIRINPQHSTQEHGIYDPCAEGSRLGVTRANFKEELLEGMEGLHFHTLCEQNSDALIETLVAVEERFGDFLPQMKWVNFGGGHHITREDYDREALIDCIQQFKEKYDVQVYLEPGEAVALNAGYLVASVLDIVHNGIDIALLDASAACHMPDVIEMPYRPPLYQGGEPKEKPYTYRLAGATCLAGDVIGDYSFEQPLSIGDKLIFEDMAIYSMVKNNTFNGMCLPSIALLQENGEMKTIRQFGYGDFKERLS
ncbi:carboxynorspermidine/carboxyspermidine decarboxylase [Anaerotignum neopropionicum]|uniref:Carboxynorspermidine/carboxyspermidine decarboxylase n=1 Tax=Anaerotignum neopropionicum TaxID=36847 RepID=A0A136WEX1_9FIRM|nr:carboxynorspermidine decarboxylase [Anaerotignum neopropionicum]KXL53098.1 carboxynorspermidine/carboxyspermidine decarboxylase [Anaerotignum neopropionicum]